MSSPDDKLIAFLEKRGRPGAIMFAPPGDPKRDYLGSGSHPDIVTRIWKDINDTLPADCRTLVYGTPSLAHPRTHMLLSVTLGTQYIVRASEEAIEHGLPADASTVIEWWKNQTDLGEFGPDWVVGKWRPEELAWCSQNFFQNDVENP